MQAAAIQTDIQIVQNGHDDLAKSKGNNRQIIAFQLQNRNGDQPAKEAGHQSTAENSKDKDNSRTGNPGRKDRGCNHCRKSAKRHKASLAKVQLTRYADIHIQTNGRKNIGSYRYKQRTHLPVESASRNHYLHNCKQNNHNQNRSQLLAAALFHFFPLLHASHLILSPKSSCRAGRSV